MTCLLGVAECILLVHSSKWLRREAACVRLRTSVFGWVVHEGGRHPALYSCVHFSTQAKHRERGSLAAAKIVELGDGDELDDFVVEIDILAACGHHPHILSLEEAYLFKGKLWVRTFPALAIPCGFAAQSLQL